MYTNLTAWCHDGGIMLKIIMQVGCPAVEAHSRIMYNPPHKSLPTPAVAYSPVLGIRVTVSNCISVVQTILLSQNAGDIDIFRLKLYLIDSR